MPQITQTSDVVFESREDAVSVMDAIHQLLAQYEQVTLSDFFELSGVPSTFLDYKQGWTELTDMKLAERSPGWAISLPETKVFS